MGIRDLDITTVWRYPTDIYFGPGGIAGATMAVTAEPSPVDAITIEPCRVLVWHVETVAQLLEKRPKVRAALQAAVSLDLARKVQILADR